MNVRLSQMRESSCFQTLFLGLSATPLWLTGCGGYDEPVTPPTPVPTEVAVSPDETRLEALGTTVQLSATVRDQNGQVMSGVAIAWASSAATVATVNAVGLVTALSRGSVRITAAAGTASGSAGVMVEQVVVDLAVSPAGDTLVAIGDTARFLTEARDANGYVAAGVEVAWSSEDEAVVTVDDSGLATAVGNGTANVRASSDELFDSAIVTVEQRPARINAVSGNRQEGIRGHQLPQPLIVRVEDEGGTGVAEVPVTFSPGKESGTVSRDAADTDPDGRVSTVWTLGSGRTQSVAVFAPGGLATEFSASLVSGQYECGGATRPTNVLEVPIRAISASGYWGTNEEVVPEWMKAGTGPLVPADYIAWIKGLHVNWVGIVVSLLLDDSMDSTLERGATTFPEPAIRQFVRDLRAEDIDVYVTLAIDDWEARQASRPVWRWQLGDPGDPGRGVRLEYWPWRPDHPDHERFVSEFWESYTEQAVHFARVAQEEGARMFSLGTETDRLFRTRAGGYNTVTHFGEQLASMVDRVRAVYDGLLTYDMHYDVLKVPDFFGPGSFCLWEDLNLDVMGISAWFDLVDAPPPSVMSVASLEMAYDRIFREYLIPLANDNPERPIVFLEYGAMDLVIAPLSPGNTTGQGERVVFTDANGNGIDDGRETQANIYEALFNIMEAYTGVVDGAFLWDNWMASDERWSSFWAHARNYDIRGKPAGEVVRAAYESLRR